MTTRKDLKALIRERMAKTHESYTTARRHVLAAGKSRCPSCKGKLSTRTIQVMPDLDDMLEDVTEGQLADYFAAEESGEYGEWGIEATEEYCPRCESRVTTVVREFDPFDEDADEED